MCSCSSRVIPRPVSDTVSTIECSSASRPTAICPRGGVYKWAFVIRFVAIWRRRAGSASAGGRSRGSCSSNSCALSAMRGSIRVATSRTASTTSVDRRWISNCPASMRATSSRSFTRSTSRFVESRITSTNSRCFASSPSDRDRSSTNPLIDVSGLRSSCEAVATNSDFSRSSRARSEMSRIVQTAPPPSISAAVTARICSSSLSTMTSPRSASSWPGSGESGPCDGEPGSSSGTSSRARGLTDTTVPSASHTTSASPRLSIVTARRRRSSIRRW